MNVSSSSRAICPSSTIGCSPSSFAAPGRAMARGCGRRAASNRSSPAISATRATAILAEIHAGRLKASDLGTTSCVIAEIAPSRARSLRVGRRAADQRQHARGLRTSTISPSMILPVHAAVRTALADTLTTRFSIAPDDQPAIVIDVPPSRALGDLAVPVAFELARRLRQAPRAIAQADRRRARPDCRRGTCGGDAERLPQLLSRPGGADRTVAAERARRRCRIRRQGHRRAHGHQSEQGRAHRPSSKRDARRHARAAPPLSGPAGRGAELHRRHGCAGRRRGRRLHDARGARSRRRAIAHRRLRRSGSTTTAGISTRE